MRQRLASIAFGLILATASTAPTLAFWERSQWSRCSDAPTAAEWHRYRCPDIEPYHDGIVHRGYDGAVGDPPDLLYPQGRRLRGGVVKRLG